jgi:hypothetical protein
MIIQYHQHHLPLSSDCAASVARIVSLSYNMNLESQRLEYMTFSIYLLRSMVAN